MGCMISALDVCNSELKFGCEPPKDDYLNGFFRSLKCWREGNQVGGRMEAAQPTD
jgi:hypothetical protein